MILVLFCFCFILDSLSLLSFCLESQWSEWRCRRRRRRRRRMIIKFVPVHFRLSFWFVYFVFCFSVSVLVVVSIFHIENNRIEKVAIFLFLFSISSFFVGLFRFPTKYFLWHFFSFLFSHRLIIIWRVKKPGTVNESNDCFSLVFSFWFISRVPKQNLFETKKNRINIVYTDMTYRSFVFPTFSFHMK